MGDFANSLVFVTMAFAALGLCWKYWPTDTYIVTKLDNYYDYVIIGGGTAGCVLANRLSEDGKTRVALLEAGIEDTAYPIAEIPLAAFDLQRTGADWSDYTTTQNHSCLGLNNHQSLWPRGKVLGGSGTIGNLMYVRGNTHDYDEWAANGCEGWNYDNVLPYFKTSEKNNRKDYIYRGFHGDEGPQMVNDARSLTRLSNTFLNSMRELGYKVLDVNGESQLGATLTQLTTHFGRRYVAVSSYLRPALSRKNLHVITGVHGTKVLFKGRRAIGAEYLQNGTLHAVRVRKEVILSAGTVGSAQMLMLSGIGPRKHLEELGITVVSDVPVGNNLQDHVTTDAMHYRLTNPITVTMDKAKGILTLLDYMVFGAGFLSSTSQEAHGFFRSRYQPDNLEYPFLQMIMQGMITTSSREGVSRIKKNFNLKEKVYKDLYLQVGDREGITLYPVLLHPQSRGTVRLRSRDPLDKPLINPNYFSHPDDINVLIDGIHLAEAIMETKAFQKAGPARIKTIHPNCVNETYDTDAYWHCFIRHNTLTGYNPVGTCKMGSVEDPSTVVNYNLSVKGVSHLRVVDASVIPNSISGGTYATVMMIAEKAADAILGIDSIKLKAERKKMKDSHDHKFHGEL